MTGYVIEYQGALGPIYVGPFGLRSLKEVEVFTTIAEASKQCRYIDRILAKRGTIREVICHEE